MPTNTYVALQKSTVTTPVLNVTLNSIPATYTDLVLVIKGARSGSGNNISLRLNGATTGYSCTYMEGDGSTAYSGRQANDSNMRIAAVAGGTGTSEASLILQFANYSNTSISKSVLSRYSEASTVSGITSGLWQSSNAINSIEIGRSATINWTTGTTFSLYGIAAEGSTAKATGGVIYSDSTYYYHVFGSTGVFTPSTSLTADILCVAGGGAGGNDAGAGGGAGGVIYFTNQSLTATNYTCTVGAGGASSNTLSAGISGSNSTFTGLTAAVGGGGGTTSAGVAGAGGSGGGGGRNTYQTGGATTQTGTGATAYHGFAGGNSTAAAYPAGGGGAGAVGGNSASLISGNGGNGTSAYSSSFSAATGIGQNVNGTYYLAGGGGGGANSSNGSGTGGYGGGGAGAPYDAAGLGIKGTANTGGGGGGGGGGYGITTNAAAGGSGIIVVRYLKA
jgi:hypothetical protein